MKELLNHHLVYPILLIALGAAWGVLGGTMLPRHSATLYVGKLMDAKMGFNKGERGLQNEVLPTGYFSKTLLLIAIMIGTVILSFQVEFKYFVGAFATMWITRFIVARLGSRELAHHMPSMIDGINARIDIFHKVQKPEMAEQARLIKEAMLPLLEDAKERKVLLPRRMSVIKKMTAAEVTRHFEYGSTDAVPEDSSIDDLMTGHADDAIQSAFKHFDVHLDRSPESVEQVEGILDRLHRDHVASPRSDKELGSQARMWGAYLGAVIKTVRPGKWELDSEVAGPGSLPLVFGEQDMTFPCAWVYKRLTNGPEDNVWLKFQVLIMKRDDPNLGAFETRHELPPEQPDVRALE